jgi:hypothetical protein
VNKEEQRVIIARADELRNLVKEFGLELIGFDPGISASIIKWPNYSVHFDETEWAWLRPLLEELKTYRDNMFLIRES